MSTPSLLIILRIFGLLLHLTCQLATTVHGAPPGCEEVLQNLTEECTLPTIVKCEDEPPICTAEHTIEFERKCLKCKNKKTKHKDKGSRVNDNQKKKIVVMPMAAAEVVLREQRVMTRARAKAICHRARQEESVDDCLDDIVKCGDRPAICGRDQLRSCREDEALMVCESIGFLKPRSAAAAAAIQRQHQLLGGTISSRTMLLSITTTATMVLVAMIS